MFRVKITLDDGKTCVGTGNAKDEDEACMKAEFTLMARYSNVKIIKSEAWRI